MAKACGCSRGSGGAERLDPQACNALTRGVDGLLAPRVEITGVPGDAPVGAERSVTVDVTHVAGCPDQYTIGARLAAPSEVVQSASLDLQPTASNTWTVVPGSSITLPEAGTYQITGKMYAHMRIPSGNAFITGRIIRDDTSVVVDESLIINATEPSTSPNPGNVHQATAPFLAEITVSGPTTLHMEARRVGTTGEASIQGSGAGTTRIGYMKVAD